LLARDRYQAIGALIYLGGLHPSRQPGASGLGHKFAKEAQLRATGGKPLTICMGDRYRVDGRNRHAVETAHGEFTFALDGCRSIFPDVV